VATAAVGVTVVSSVVSSTASTTAADTVTLTVGLLQDVDSPNVTVGYTVAAYELWNLQYATLTDKSADDFSIIEGLAESWEASPDGLTFTYHLRDGLKWSDGEPLTAEDVAWTINTSRDQEWTNHFATTANLTATAVDDQTLTIVTSVPDPKLPTMDVYIVPKHIWESHAGSADDLAAFDALDGVGSGPFTLKERKANQEWTMVANPNYWKGKPAIDQVVFRVFSDGDAMVTALRSGEIDVAHLVPSQAFEDLKSEADIVTVAGAQGGFTELAMNGMAGGLGDGHPALQDLTVRHAIAQAIDREALFDRVVKGQGEQIDTLGVSPDSVWTPTLPADQQLNYDPTRANAMLDEAGYLDVDGNGIREMPGGGNELKFRYAERSDSVNGAAIRELIEGWLSEIGIALDVSVFDDTQLGQQIYDGTYDLFVWGWTPFVDPDPMLSYFTCAQLTTDAASPGYNDANWCSPEYDAMYTQQNQELDRAKRIDIVKQMITLFYTESTYVVLYHDADTQAYRTDRFTGWTQQPKGTGPVVFSNTSPTYFNLKPIEGGGGDDSSSTGLLIGIIGGVLVLLVIGGVLIARSRATADERE
jgi:peptide/nickel transport system substrate-binding protein